MPTNIPLAKPGIQEQINQMHDRVTYYGLQLAPWPRVRALAPAGATYPRAGVVRLESGKWGISIKHTTDHWIGDLILDDEGEPLAFDCQRGALSHAARTIHALRARRHPAGQSWLRGGR